MTHQSSISQLSHHPKREEDVIELSDSDGDEKPQLGQLGAGAAACFDLWESSHIQELMDMAKEQKLKLEYSQQR